MEEGVRLNCLSLTSLTRIYPIDILLKAVRQYITLHKKGNQIILQSIQPEQRNIQ
jgi:hypothetical protein